MLRFVRVTESKDINNVARLADIIWREHYDPIVGPEMVSYMLENFQSEKAIEQKINEGYHYYLIIHDKVDVGYFGVQKRTDILFLSKLYILKPFRGMGIGQQVIEFLECDYECRIIQLTVNKGNSSSIGFYEAIGFEIVDEVDYDVGGGFATGDYVMELRK